MADQIDLAHAGPHVAREDTVAAADELMLRDALTGEAKDAPVHRSEIGRGLRYGWVAVMRITLSSVALSVVR